MRLRLFRRSEPKWPENIKVSGLMVIERPALLESARAAQDCFLRQTWPLKELLVFNATGSPLNRWSKRGVRELRLCRMSRAFMLHVLRENAQGEWCVIWDPDCYYEPTVLEEHTKVADRETAILFRHITVYSLTDRKAYVVGGGDRVAHGSFLRLAKIDFTQPFFKQTPRVNVIDVPATLVTKFVNKIAYE